MTIETEPFDAADYLNTPEDIANFLDAAVEDGTPEEIRASLLAVARFKGMKALAKETGLTREALYKALDENGNPTLDTLLKVIGALGLRLSVSSKTDQTAKAA